MEHGWGINGREQTLGDGDLNVPLNFQNRSWQCLAVLEPFKMNMKAAWRG